MPPVRGRSFTREEEQTKDRRVAVLADSLWRRLGADPTILGKTVMASDIPFTVVGVLPPGFQAPLAPQAEFFNIMDFSPPLQDRSYSYATVIGRLKAGVTAEAAQADMDRVAASIALDYPQDMHQIGAAIQPLRAAVAGKAARILALLLGAGALVLLVACLNVANLTLARVDARRTELAVRVALGAKAGAMVRLFVNESVLLAAVAVTLGIGLGSLYLAVIRRLAPPQTPRLDAIRLDGTVVLGIVALALLGGLLAGLLPALWTYRRRAFASLRVTAATASRYALRTRGLLVAAEIAASLVLLVVAGQLVRTLAALDRVDPGFRAEGLVLGHLIVVPKPINDLQQSVAYASRLEERLRQRPEIAEVGLIMPTPLVDRPFPMGFSIDTQTDRAEQLQTAEFRLVTPAAFRTLGMHLEEGRLFDSRESAASPPVAIVNRRFVRRYLAGRSPLGRRIRSVFNEGDQAPRRLIVGVVNDVRVALDRAPEPEIYIPLVQEPGAYFTVVARARSSETVALAALQAVARQLRPGQVVQRPETMEEALRRGLSPRRFSAGVIDSFAMVALLLVAVGVYGITALVVSQRRRELAVRMALGAAPWSIAALVLRWVAAFTLVGLVAGLASTLASGRLVANLLYGIGPMDELSLVGGVALLLAATLAATLVPTVRATRVNPAPVLSAET
jgi:putative ABC transport system permease protein